VTIKSIQISRTPSNLHYIEGETLDTIGLALTVNYSNGSSQDITGGYTVNETKLSTIGTNVISVSYQGHVATFEVFVREKQVIQVEKVTDPTKLQYNVGDTISTAGLTLKVKYDNKEEKTIDSGYSVNTTLLNTPGQISVKVTYKDKSVYFTVTVNPKNVEDVKVEALTKNSAKVKWTKQSKVSGYQVYMSTSEKGKYVKVATVAGTKSAYTVKKLEESKTYYFKRLKSIFAETENLPGRQRLTAIYKSYLEYNWNNPEMDFWNSIYYFPPEIMRETIVKTTTESKVNFINDLTKVMEEGILKKEFKSLDARSMAMAFYYLITCITMSTELMNKEQGFRETDQCFEVFWEGIKGM
jgi:hypothetical protein